MNGICQREGHDPKMVGGDDVMVIRCSRCGENYQLKCDRCDYEVVQPFHNAPEEVLFKCKKCGRSLPT